MTVQAVPILRTPRLTLRPLEPTDAPQITAGIGNYDVARWMSSVPYPYAEADATWFIDKTLRAGDRVWAIIAREGLIGVIGADPHFGYWLARHAWRKGYGFEAAQAVAAHWFSDPDAPDLPSAYFAGNDRSAAVLHALGFETVRTALHDARALSQQVEAFELWLTRARWQARQDFRLRTERLTIRPLTPDDDETVRPLGHHDVARQTASVTPDWTRKVAHRWLKSRTWHGGAHGMFGVFREGALIGAVGSGGYPGNAGWMFLPEHWGKGYATEALRAFLPAFMARTTHSALAAEVFEDNAPSRRVAEKLGFEEVGRGTGMSPARLDLAPVVKYRLSRDAAMTLGSDTA